MIFVTQLLLNFLYLKKHLYQCISLQIVVFGLLKIVSQQFASVNRVLFYSIKYR